MTITPSNQPTHQDINNIQRIAQMHRVIKHILKKLDQNQHKELIKTHKNNLYTYNLHKLHEVHQQLLDKLYETKNRATQGFLKKTQSDYQK